MSEFSTKTIRRPSGDQLGSPGLPMPRYGTTVVGSTPSSPTIDRPPDSSPNAILEPSGDQATRRPISPLAPGSARRSKPSASIVCTAPPSMKAIFVPSGDQAGAGSYALTNARAGPPLAA